MPAVTTEELAMKAAKEIVDALSPQIESTQAAQLAYDIDVDATADIIARHFSPHLAALEQAEEALRITEAQISSFYTATMTNALGRDNNRDLKKVALAHLRSALSTIASLKENK